MAEKTAEKVVKTEAEWKKQLSDEQYHVTREAGTECAFTGKYWNTKEPGMYHCVCCGSPLFDSQTKFNSGTGLAEFHQAGRGRRRGRASGYAVRHGADRSSLRQVRRASGTCV